MKRIALLIMLTLACAAFGQAVRVDPTNVMSAGSAPPTGLPALFAIPYANVSICGYPANATPCTNFAQTFTDATANQQCPPTSPVVLNGTNTCGPITDAGGAFGFWLQPGNYTYMITDNSGKTFGPYFLSAPASTLTGLYLGLGGGTLTGPLVGTTGSFNSVTSGAFTGSSASFGNASIGTLTGTTATIGTVNATTSNSTNAVNGTINGIIQADQYAGADACVKIRAAASFAVTNGKHQIDATHFDGNQTCSVDVFGALKSPTASNVSLTVNFGSVHFLSTVMQTVTNSGLVLRGQGMLSTIWEYTGPGTPGAIFWEHAEQPSGVTNGVQENEITGMSFITNGLTTEGLLLQDMNRSHVMNVFAWGSLNCGIRTEGNVTTTMIRPKVSIAEATLMGIAAYNQPNHGLCFDGSSASGNQTTNGTVVDAAAEGVKQHGWWLLSAQTLTFTSGTSEGNAQGLQIDGLSKFNTFTGSDLEANTGNTTGVDVIDNSGFNTFNQIISLSHCASPCTSNMLLTGSGGNDWVIGQNSVQGFGLYGFTPDNPHAGATLPGSADGYMDMYIRGAVVYVPYFTTLP